VHNLQLIHATRTILVLSFLGILLLNVSQVSRFYLIQKVQSSANPFDGVGSTPLQKEKVLTKLSRTSGAMVSFVGTTKPITNLKKAHVFSKEEGENEPLDPKIKLKQDQKNLPKPDKTAQTLST
jgi:hypothetical protein